MSSRILRGITIGAGHFGEIQLEAWQHVQGAQIVGLVSRTVEKVQKLANVFNIEHVGNDLERMVDEVKPDFIDICTPPDSHYHYTKLAADIGLPVLCQKPVAPSQEESRALVNYCRDKNVPIMINENWRWQGWYREVKRIMDSNAIGKPYHAYIAMRPGDGWGEKPFPDQPYFKDMEKFLLFETGVHYFDTCRFLFGEIKSVFCQTRRINPIIKGEDLVLVFLDFMSGMTGIYDANRTTYMEVVRPPAYSIMTIEGEQGKIRIDLDGRIFVTQRGGTEQEHAYAISSGWRGGCAIATQQHFIDVLLKGGVFETDGLEYMQSQEIVYACYRSAATNQVVTLLEA